MVLVGGAGEEIAGRRGEGQEHEQQEAGERPPVPRPGARRQRRRCGGRRLDVAAASPAAPAALRLRAPRPASASGPARRRRVGRGLLGRPGRRLGSRRRGARVVPEARPPARRCGRSSGGGVIGPLDRPSSRLAPPDGGACHRRAPGFTAGAGRKQTPRGTADPPEAMAEAIPAPAAAIPPPVRPGRPRLQRLRVIAALVLRGMGTRNGRAAGGYLWAIAQPLGSIAPARARLQPDAAVAAARHELHPVLRHRHHPLPALRRDGEPGRRRDQREPRAARLPGGDPARRGLRHSSRSAS